MIAIKLARTDTTDVAELQRQFGAVVRFCFNRYADSKGMVPDVQVLRLAHGMNHIERLDGTMLLMAMRKAHTIYKVFEQRDGTSLLFGGKSNWHRYCKHLITKDEFDANRQSPICVEGDRSHRGNRKFALDLDHDRIVFKPSKSEHYDIRFTCHGKSRRALLAEIQRRYDEREDLCFSVELSRDFVTLIINETEFADEAPHIDGRRASVDMNPNYIALVIRDEHGRFLEQEIFDLKRINDLDKRRNYANKQDKVKWRSHLNNKRRHEILHVSKRIASQCAHYRISDFVIEDLDIKSKDYGKGKAFNKLCLNSWMRRLLASSLRKRMNLLGIRFHEVYAGYSSIKGQLENAEKVDSIAAAIEMGNRLNKKDLRKFGETMVDPGRLSNHWKKEIGANFKQAPSWRQVSEFLKKNYPGNSYRVLFSECHPALRVSYRMSSGHSLVRIHRFDDTRILRPSEMSCTAESHAVDSAVQDTGSKLV